ncbi:MAG TPA: helix-turn-helix transcriptional regulator [Mollicutes bacterium]|nr:helix-turn-helix transcriptional regulator [Mollicutes bacterium]
MRNLQNPDEIYEFISKRIKFFRKYRKLTQEQLAELTLYSRGLIGNIESPRTKQGFSLAVLYTFAQALDIPLELFVKEDISEELRKMGINEKDFM